MTVLLTCWAVLASLLAAGGAYATLKLSAFVFDLEDEVDDCIDAVEDCAENMKSLAATEVMSDEPVVRQAIDELSNSLKVLENVSKKISEYSITGR